MRISDWSSDVCSSDLLAEIILELINAPSPGLMLERPITSLILEGSILTARRTDTEGRPSIFLSVIGRPEDDRSLWSVRASEERYRKIGSATSELQSLMRISYAVFCLKKKTHKTN